MFENLLKTYFLSKKEILYVDTISFTYKQLSDKKTQLEKLSICNTTNVFSNVRERT